MIDEAELAALHGAVEQALRRGDERGLRVVGYGEISLAVGWPVERPAIVAKRLPPFATRARYDAHAALVAEYVAALEAAGIEVVETALRAMPGERGGVIGYALQPALPAATIGPRVLAATPPDPDDPLLGAALDAVGGTVGPRLGLDAQLSNWAWLDERALYLDVTTPLLRDARGHDRLDAETIARAFPWALRGALRRFVAPRVLATYHDARTVCVDLAANLVKERLEAWLPAVLAAVGERVGPPPDEQEVRRYYRSDARLWEAIQRIRRADRRWHRLRGRTYPFLIPGEIRR